jgi:uncharacterized protein (TIGR02996 family)
MNDEQALLASILADPQDDAPRMIFADWLDEHDQGERAEYIRLAIELARWDCPRWRCDENGFRQKTIMEYRANAGGIVGVGQRQVPCHCGRVEALKREREMYADMPNPFGDNSIVWCTRNVRHQTSDMAIGCHFRRGFVSRITTTMSLWLAHGPAIVRCQPVEFVEVSDRRPFRSFDRNQEEWYWIEQTDGEFVVNPHRGRTREAMVPYSLFDAGLSYARFPTEAAARQALSMACLAFARAQSREPVKAEYASVDFSPLFVGP